MMKAAKSSPAHLYVHVPFCRHICYYCDFVHGIYREQSADAWLDALEKEIALRTLPEHLDTIYIGGGTPTALSAAQLQRLLSLLDGKSPYEYTVEADPGTIDVEKAVMLVKHGVNRVSIGMQSADDGLLKAIGRHHTHADTIEAVSLLKNAGIDNLSLDLLYSLPGQTMEMLKDSVQAACALSPKHISVYSLTIEENTVFGKKGMHALDEDTEADMYEYLRDTLPAYGYHRYETANFAKKGYESRHNLCYWNYRDFFGFSCGASGKAGNVRYDKTRSLSEYLKDPLAAETIELTPKDAMFECIMMNLRKKEGLLLSDFEEMFQVSVFAAFGEKLQKLLKEGSLCTDDKRLYCSEHGYDILNSILTELL